MCGCLVQFYANLYGIPVPAGQSDPDIFITLEILGDATDIGLYCNPGWGQYADVNANYPQPGYAIWQSGIARIILPLTLLPPPLCPVIMPTWEPPWFSAQGRSFDTSTICNATDAFISARMIRMLGV